MGDRNNNTNTNSNINNIVGIKKMVEGNNTTKPTTTITTTQSIPKLKNYIRGRFQAPVNEQYIDGLNPATKQVLFISWLFNIEF